MPKIFISYRRSASAGHAGRLYDRLIVEYGADDVFLDMEQIPVGETFSTYLLAKIDESEVFLLMLGEGTLDRCQDPEDWVRREIAFALQHPSLVVIPVLQDGFKMPAPETLPADIQAITVKNASFLFHQLFDESVSKLIHSINQLFPAGSTASSIPVQVRQDASTPQPPKGMGKIKIHRVSVRMAYRIRPFTMKLNGNEVGHIGNDETVEFDVPAGVHVLGVQVDFHYPQKQIVVREGEVVQVEINVRNMGMSVTIDEV